MNKLFAFVLCVLMVLAAAACAAPAVEPAAEPEAPVEEPAAPAEEPAEPVEEPAAPVDPNLGLYTYTQQPGEASDINSYYNPLGVECDVSFRNMGGTVTVAPEMDPAFVLPTPVGEYTIGFSVYYTVDEVGAMVLETMKSLAEQAGMTLLVNDANYDQNAQNQAVEQWI